MPQRARFLVLFGVVLFGLFLVLEARGLRGFLPWACDATASVLGRVLQWLGIPCQVGGDSVYFPDKEMLLVIIDECTGISAVVMVLAFIVAYPASLTRKAGGILIAVPLLVLLNLLRLILAGMALRVSIRMFTIVHDYLWEIGYMAFTFAYCIAWVKWARTSRVSSGIA